MIKFNVVNAKQEEEQDTVVDAELTIDKAGHLCLCCNGVVVATISADPGILYAQYLSLADADILRRAGFLVKNREMEVR